MGLRTFAILIAGWAWLSMGALTFGQSWSPDGLWLAYTTPRVVSASSRHAFVDELVQVPVERDSTDPWSLNRNGGSRLWTTRIDTNDSVQIDEQVDGWITEPAWGLKGRALAYGRVISPGQGQPARLELVVRDSLDQSRVAGSWPWSPALETENSQAAQGVTWNPDGSLLTVPFAADGSRGLLVVRAGDGSLVARLPGASFPAWNPEGASLAYVYQGPDLKNPQSGIGVWAPGGGSSKSHPLPSTVLMAVPGRPEWIEEGKFLLFPSAKGQAPASQVDQLLIGILSVDGRKAAAQEMIIPVNAPTRAIQSFEIAVDPQGEGIFTSHAVSGSLSTFTWFRGGNGAVYKRFSPFDQRSPLVAMSLNSRPGMRRIAYRVMGRDGVSPPAICDPGHESFEPLVPDAASNELWQRTIAQGILLLASETNEAGADPKAIFQNRPTRMPVRGELALDHPTLLKMRRLGLQGQLLRENLAQATSGNFGPSEPSVYPLVAAIASGDQDQALAELDRLNLEDLDLQTRLRLQGLRAQLYLSGGDLARASAVVDHLRFQAQRSGLEMSEFGGRTVLGPPVIPNGLTWIDSLQDRIKDVESGKTKPAADLLSPLGLRMQVPEDGAAGPERMIPQRDLDMPGPPAPAPPVDLQKRRPILIEPEDE